VAVGVGEGVAVGTLVEVGNRRAVGDDTIVATRLIGSLATTVGTTRVCNVSREERSRAANNVKMTAAVSMRLEVQREVFDSCPITLRPDRCQPGSIQHGPQPPVPEA